MLQQKEDLDISKIPFRSSRIMQMYRERDWIVEFEKQAPDIQLLFAYHLGICPRNKTESLTRWNQGVLIQSSPLPLRLRLETISSLYTRPISKLKISTQHKPFQTKLNRRRLFYRLDSQEDRAALAKTMLESDWLNSIRSVSDLDNLQVWSDSSRAIRADMPADTASVEKFYDGVLSIQQWKPLLRILGHAHLQCGSKPFTTVSDVLNAVWQATGLIFKAVENRHAHKRLALFRQERIAPLVKLFQTNSPEAQVLMENCIELAEQLHIHSLMNFGQVCRSIRLFWLLLPAVSRFQ